MHAPSLCLGSIKTLLAQLDSSAQQNTSCMPLAPRPRLPTNTQELRFSCSVWSLTTEQQLSGRKAC